MEATRIGRPPLTERRKAETRLEIARQAVRLFTERGVAATSAEEIASAAGISVRTLWRYSPTKERCVLPLLSAGIDLAAQSLRGWPPDRGIAELVDDLERSGGELTEDAPAVLHLVRLTRAEPLLRAVWLQAHDDAEPVFAAALARRAGLPEPDLASKVLASAINAALRVAVEHYAFDTVASADDRSGLLHTVRAALEIVASREPLIQPEPRTRR
ncbi:TetR/AcrR family transcriptional regulator [Flindersiella endophytica]